MNKTLIKKSFKEIYLNLDKFKETVEDFKTLPLDDSEELKLYYDVVDKILKEEKIPFEERGMFLKIHFNLSYIYKITEFPKFLRRQIEKLN